MWLKKETNKNGTGTVFTVQFAPVQFFPKNFKIIGVVSVRYRTVV